MDTSPVFSDSWSIIQVIRKPLNTKNVRTPRPSGKNGTCKWWKITRSTATARNPSRDRIFFWLRLVLSLGFRTEACASLSAMTKWDDSPHRWRNDCPRGIGQMADGGDAATANTRWQYSILGSQIAIDIRCLEQIISGEYCTC